jgi:pseudomonalisin
VTKLIPAAALCACGFLAAPLAANAATRTMPLPAAPPGWAPTATRAIVPLHALDLGAVSGTMPVHVVVGLRLRDPAGAEALVRHQNTRGDALYHHTVTPAAFTARFGPTANQSEAVARYLGARGFSNVHVSANRQLVDGTARVAVVQSAFHTELHAFRQTFAGQTRTFYANVTPAFVPSPLRGTVLSVLGLHNMAAKPFLRKSPAAIQRRIAALQRSAAQRVRPDAKPTSQPCFATPVNGVCSREYGPYDFQAAYDAWKQPTGKHTSIAIFAEGDVSQVPIDLATYQQMFGIKAHFPVTVIQVGTPSSDTSGQDEFDLDTQVSTAIADKVKHLYIYDTTSLSDSDTTLEFNQFVVDMKAQAASASFGEPEADAYADGAMFQDDQIFNEAAAQGQTVFASAGDNGAACPVLIATGVPFVPGVVGVCYPADSPYVTGVGGTTLMTDENNSTYGGEIAWQGTGGGQSEFELPPSWTTPVVPTQYSVDGTERTIPDIAMDADNNISPAIVVVSGTAEGVGGTSLSSPLALGSWARLLSDHPGAFGSNAPFGYAPPAFYYEAAQFPIPTPPPVPTGPPGFQTSMVGGYHDIYFGSNGLWTGAPGYDLVTGIGTFDIGAQMADIDLPGAP